MGAKRDEILKIRGEIAEHVKYEAQQELENDENVDQMSCTYTYCGQYT